MLQTNPQEHDYALVRSKYYEPASNTRVLYWRTRIPGKGRIVIGNEPVKSDELNDYGHKTIPPGTAVNVYEMSVVMVEGEEGS